MGETYRGIPSTLALRLRDEYNLRFFIETGTLVGNTAKWASEHFEQVYTIECSYKFYIIARSKLSGISNVQLIHGFSQHALDGILPSLTGSALIWLDAHWSKDLGYNCFAQVLCPVLEEIEIVAKFEADHVILIDDLRLFGHQSGWPRIGKVKKALEKMGKKVTYITDVVVAVPNGKI